MGGGRLTLAGNCSAQRRILRNKSVIASPAHAGANHIKEHSASANGQCRHSIRYLKEVLRLSQVNEYTYFNQFCNFNRTKANRKYKLLLIFTGFIINKALQSYTKSLSLSPPQPA